MANETHPATKIYSAHSDAIRIVPLFVADGVVQPTAEAAKAAPAAPPKLTYRNGPLLTAVEVFTIFWGPAWQQSPQSTMTTQINQFFDFILTSPLIDQLAEYSVPGKPIGHGKRTGTTTITTPKLGNSVSDTAIQHMLQQEISTSMANHLVATLSAAFSFARRAGICTYNPCIGAERNVEVARKVVITDEIRDKLLAAAPLALRLIASMSDVTGLRKTDIRLLLRSQVSDEAIRVTPSKTKRRTGKTLEFQITPAVRAILDQATALPGRKISMYVFPTRKGTPYSESALQTAWTRAKVKAGLEDVDLTFRDLRTTELNAIHREGGDATKTAGHATSSTTERHYISEPTRIKPRR